MDIYRVLSSLFTVVSLVTFVGIVLWAWSGRRGEEFSVAAKAPFALPDEAELPVDTRRRGAGR